jgi:hypothetical protein
MVMISAVLENRELLFSHIELFFAIPNAISSYSGDCLFVDSMDNWRTLFENLNK